MSAILAEEPSEEKQSQSRRQANERTAVSIEALPENIANELVQLFKLLSDETRLRILYYLTQCQELNVGTLCGLLQQSQPAVSHHLALLRVAKLIDMRREGKHNYYRFIPERLQEHSELIQGILGQYSNSRSLQRVGAPERSETD